MKHKHHWIVSSLFAVALLLYYLSNIANYFHLHALQGEFFDRVNDLHRTFFLVPIFYASYYFRLKGAIVASILAFVLSLPRALYFSPLSDSLFGLVILSVSGFVISYMMALFLNETDREKKLAVMLSESERKYRIIIESMQEGYHEVDLKGNFTFFNESMRKIMGYRREELLGMNNRQYADGENARKIYEAYNRVYRTGEPEKNFECQIIRKDGTRRDIDVSISLIRDVEAHSIGFRGLVRDMTDRKRAVEALLESEKRLSSIIQGFSIPTFVVGRDHRVLYWNQALEIFSRIPAKEVIGTNKQWRAFYALEQPCLADLLVDDAIDKIPGRYEGIYIKSNLIDRAYEAIDFFPDLGEKGQWLHITAVTILDSQGNIFGAIETLENVTERKQMEEALRNSEEKYKTLAEKSMAGVYVVQDGKFCFINSKAASYAGYIRGELLGRKAGLLISPEDREEVRQNYKAMLLGERSSPYEFRIFTKQGETRWIMETVTSILHEGRPAVLGNSMDITTHKQMEEEIRTLSLTDPLTGLYNRRGFLTLAEQQLRIAKRTKSGFMLLFADLDGMKWINDSLGHNKGDEALIETAGVLKKVFRDADIVARVGGDEFSVLAMGIKMEDSKIIEDHLLYQIGINNSRENRVYSLSISVGMAFYDPENPSTIDELIFHADELMYNQKKSKRS